MQIAKKNRMSGIILDSMDVVTGMEPSGLGHFIPIEIKNNAPKKSELLVSLNDFNSLLKKVYELILHMSKEIFCAKIAPNSAGRR